MRLGLILKLGFSGALNVPIIENDNILVLVLYRCIHINIMRVCRMFRSLQLNHVFVN